MAQKSRGGVEDTRLEAKAKDTKKIWGQGQPFRGKTLSRPRTGMLEAKAKDQGHKHKCSPKKKVFTKIFQAISTKKRFPKNFSSAPQNFNNKKIVLSSSRGQANFRGLEASRPRPKTWPSRPRPRTSKCVLEDVLEAKDVLEDSTSAKEIWKLNTNTTVYVAIWNAGVIIAKKVFQCIILGSSSVLPLLPSTGKYS